MAFWNDPSSLSLKQQHRWVVVFYDAQAIADNKNKIGLPHYLIKSVEKPSYDIGISQTKYLYAHTFNFPKRLSWRPITLTLYDAFFAKEDFQVKYAKNYDNKGSVLKGPQNEKRASSESILFRMLLEAGYFSPQEKSEEMFQYNYHFKNDLIRSLVSPVGSDRSFNDKFEINDKHLTKYWMEIKHLDGNGDSSVDADVWQLYNPYIADYKTDKLDYSADGASTITLTINYDWAKLIPGNKPSIDFKLKLYSTQAKERGQSPLKPVLEGVLERGIPTIGKEDEVARTEPKPVEEVSFNPNDFLARLKDLGGDAAVSEKVITKDGVKRVEITLKFNEKDAEGKKQEKVETFNLDSKSSTQLEALLEQEKGIKFRISEKDIGAVKKSEIIQSSGLSDEVSDEYRYRFALLSDEKKQAILKGNVVFSDGTIAPSGIKAGFGEKSLPGLIATQLAIDALAASGGQISLKKAGPLYQVFTDYVENDKKFYDTKIMIPEYGIKTLQASVDATAGINERSLRRARDSFAEDVVEKWKREAGLSSVNLPIGVYGMAKSDITDEVFAQNLLTSAKAVLEGQQLEDFEEGLPSYAATLRRDILSAKDPSEDDLRKRARERFGSDRTPLEEELFGSRRNFNENTFETTLKMDKRDVETLLSETLSEIGGKAFTKEKVEELKDQILKGKESPNTIARKISDDLMSSELQIGGSDYEERKSMFTEIIEKAREQYKDESHDPLKYLSKSFGEGIREYEKQDRDAAAALAAEAEREAKAKAEAAILLTKPPPELVKMFAQGEAGFLDDILKQGLEGKEIPFKQDEYDTEKYTATIDGKEITITSQQFRALDAAVSSALEKKKQLETPPAKEEKKEEKTDQPVKTEAPAEGKKPPEAVSKTQANNKPTTAGVAAPTTATPAAKSASGGNLSFTPMSAEEARAKYKEEFRLFRNKTNILYFGDSIAQGFGFSTVKSTRGIGMHSQTPKTILDFIRAGASELGPDKKVVLSTGLANSYVNAESKHLVEREIKYILEKGVPASNIYVLGISTNQNYNRVDGKYHEKFGRNNSDPREERANAFLTELQRTYGFNYFGSIPPGSIGDPDTMNIHGSATYYRNLLSRIR